jgi:hypothetical protein
MSETMPSDQVEVPQLMRMIENHPSFKEAALGLLNASGKNDAYIEALDKSGNTEDKVRFAQMIRDYIELKDELSRLSMKTRLGVPGREEALKIEAECRRKLFELCDKASELLGPY